MPLFDCGSCNKRIKVPDSYAGKRVRCPGCSAAQRVPDLVNAAALDAFASLDAVGEVASRTVREVLIGCGVCGKSIRLKEHQLGRTAPCPACATLLRVDAFKLPPAKKRGGGLVDMSHLELDAADPLLGGGGFSDDPGGSTMGGSQVRMGGSQAGASASGYALSGSGAGVEDATSLGGGAGDSKTQQRELRELNDLKHAGGVSDEEYRNRKRDIYAGKSMAIQAMSRSTDGASDPSGRRVTGRDKPLLPGPVVALMVAAVLGVVAYVVWDNVLSPDSGRQAPPVAAAPVRSPEPALVSVPEPDPVVPDVVEAPVAALASETTPVEAEAALAEADLPAAVAEVEALVEEVPAPESPWVVTEWDIRNSTVAVPDQAMPLGRSCSHVRVLATANGSARIGVAVGPAAESFEDPAYLAFRDGQFGTVRLAAEAKGIANAIDIKQTEKPIRVGRQVVDRLTVEHKTQKGALASVLTLVQDGRAVAYWFEGRKMAYRPFISALGTAEIMSEAEIARIEAEEEARKALF